MVHSKFLSIAILTEIKYTVNILNEMRDFMQPFQIALLQLLPTGSTEGNLQKGLDACRRANAMGADLCLFPEMWSCGYNIPEDLSDLKSEAISLDSTFITAFRKLSLELDMAIGITLLEQYDPLPRNTFCLIDRHGNLILTYSKVHTCDFGSELRLTPGEDFFTASLDIGRDSVCIGAMICYDREFPESARILMLKGAEIILVPNACPMEINRLSQLRARAYENMVGIATANYPYSQPDCNGHSSVFDGMAYRPDAFDSRDTLVLEAGENEGIYLAPIPLDELRAYRKAEVHGNAYRRPGKYHLLIEETVNEPFRRPDSRR